jgi:hypothetical protein
VTQAPVGSRGVYKKAGCPTRQKAPTSISMASNQAVTSYTGLRCNAGNCGYLGLKRSEMHMHHTKNHELEGPSSNASPCQVNKTNKGLELIPGQFLLI